MFEEAKELTEHLRKVFPNSSPVLETFPSGRFTLRVRPAGEEWIMEYMPSMRTFGVSKVHKADFAWEGFDHGFRTFAEAEIFLRSLYPK